MTCKLVRAVGSRARVCVQEETCWGSLATGHSPLGFEIRSEAAEARIARIQSELLRGDRMRAKSLQGKVRPDGPFVGELQPNGIWPLLLKHALGGAVVTGGSGPYSHALAGGDTLPEGLSVETRYGYTDASFEYIRWLGGRVNQFGLQVPVDGIVTANAEMMFKSYDIEQTEEIGVPTYPANNEAFVGKQGAIRIDRTGGGVLATVATLQSINININNSIDGDQMALDGTDYRADLPEDERVVSGDFTAFFTADNYDLFRSYIGNNTLSLDLTLTRGNYVWYIEIPAFTVGGDATPKVSGRGPMSLSFTFEEIGRAHV